MSSGACQINQSVLKIAQDSPSIPQKDIIVSIILSESTASLLKLNIPNLEDLISENSQSSFFSLKSAQRVEDINCFKLPKLKKHSKNARKENEQIQTEVAYFSNNYRYESNSSFDSLDDLSDEEDSDAEYEIEEISSTPLILEPMQVYTRPLLAAKTMAHQDRIKNESNNIYIRILDSELTITSSGWVNFCRICHGGESIANLIAPCRCKGSIALAHLQCLEEWLKRSANSHCELCQHHFEVVRKPKYSIPWSIILFLLHPGEHCRELILDLLGFLVYTPTAIASTYLLMLLCDSITTRAHLQSSRNISAHFMAFTAVFGMATIDFTYSSWLILMLQKHVEAWKQWYQDHTSLQLILPLRKQRRNKRKQKNATVSRTC